MNDIFLKIIDYGLYVEVILIGSFVEGFCMNGIDVDRMYVDKRIFVLEYLEDILCRFCVVKMEVFLLNLKGYVKFVLVNLNILG